MAERSTIQAAIYESIDPVLEEIIQGLVESGSRPGMAPQPADTATTVLTKALLATLARPTQQQPMQPMPVQQISPLVAALATAFATSLAPALAQALAPAFSAVLAPAVISAVAGIAPQGMLGQQQPGQQSQQGQQQPGQPGQPGQQQQG